MQKLILEARVNEYAMREDGNRNVPYSPAEIAADAEACREAGAAILHFHARKADGAPEHAVESHADTVRRIRASSDILVHPTLGYATNTGTAEQRLTHILAMAEDEATTPHIVPIDTGSANVDRYDAQARRFATTNLVYENSTETLVYFVERLRAAGVKPQLACWNIGFTRTATALIDLGLVDEPAYVCFALTRYLAGHPGTLKGLQAHLDFLPADKAIQWTVCNYGGNLLALAGTIIGLGGHVSIGLGDYSYRELGEPSNADIIRRVAQIAKELGRPLATPKEAKAILGMR